MMKKRKSSTQGSLICSLWSFWPYHTVFINRWSLFRCHGAVGVLRCPMNRTSCSFWHEGCRWQFILSANKDHVTQLEAPDQVIKWTLSWGISVDCCWRLRKNLRLMVQIISYYENFIRLYSQESNPLIFHPHQGKINCDIFCWGSITIWGQKSTWTHK